MAAGIAPLVASSVLEVAVIAFAGWELWKLRTPKPKAPLDSPEAAPSADPPGHSVGQHGLDHR